jgi:hypothetical protein
VSRALLGTLAFAGVHAEFADAVHDAFRALDFYWDPPAYASYVSGDRYYDDNAWVSLAFVQRYRMGLSTSLAGAEQLFDFARTGWDQHAGGMFWVEQTQGMGLTNHDRGAGATAASAELGFHLHLLTRSETDRDAADMLRWVDGHLYDRGGSGLYWNATRADGSIDTNFWAYNQGVVIGAHLLRYLAAHETLSLEHAVTLARNTLSHFGDFTAQPPTFNVMLFQNLLMLHPHVEPALQETILQTVHRYGDWAWHTARDLRSSLFHFDAGPAQLQDQGAMTQLYALLAWRPSDYIKLT